MASKVVLFLMAFVLLVSTKVTSTVEEHPPKLAPACAPKNAPGHPPEHASKNHVNHGTCILKCIGEKGYCNSKNRQKRECERACVPCCEKYSCVPSTSGAAGLKECSGWETAEDTHGKTVKCP